MLHRRVLPFIAAAVDSGRCKSPGLVLLPGPIVKTLPVLTWYATKRSDRDESNVAWSVDIFYKCRITSPALNVILNLKAKSGQVLRA